MYLSINWIKEYVDIPDLVTPEKLGELLSLHVVEVDQVIDQSKQFKNIVVGKIISIKKHPNASKLQKVVVDVLSEKLNIVCGAINIKVNQYVPVALVSAILPNGTKINKASIRGEESFGMLCSEKELDLGSDHTGIYILDNKAKIGQSISVYLGLNDFILEIDNKSLTNRPDLWGYIGLAREIAAITGGKLKLPDINYVYLVEENDKLNIKIENPKKCPRYIGAILNGIKVTESPEYFKKKLVSAGIRPINNIVDITNYVMIETGQPMHAFDKLKLVDKNNDKVNIVVREANEKEVIQTLDTQVRELNSSDLLISGLSNPLAVAGVIGASNSEISLNTTEIFLESANFEPTGVRKTSQRLSLRTESSMRNEKGLDPNLPELAMSRAIKLIKELCSEAKVVGSVNDVKNYSSELSIIKINYDWVISRLGFQIEKEKIFNILTSLDFAVKEEVDNEFIVKVPSWRLRDVLNKEDVLEEIIRIYGYANVVHGMPSLQLTSPIIQPALKLNNALKNILSNANALTEVYNYSFCSEAHLSKCNTSHENYLRLKNPISEELVFLRQNLVPNILNNIKINQADYSRIELFELGNVFLKLESNLKKFPNSDENIPYQEEKLAIVLAGSDIYTEFDYLKSIVENIGSHLGFQVKWIKSATLPGWCDQERGAYIVANNQEVGYAAVISSVVIKNLNIKKDVVVCEIRLPDLLSVVSAAPKQVFIQDSRHPLVLRDLSFVLNSKIS